MSRIRIFAAILNTNTFCSRWVSIYACAHVLRRSRTQDLLSNNFTIVFNGRNGRDAHYITIFATLPSAQPAGYHSVLLSLSLVAEEDSLNASEHYEFVTCVLQVFHKSWNNIFALTGNSCSTKKSFPRRVGSIFVESSSHRCNLAMRVVIAIESITVSGIACVT